MKSNTKLWWALYLSWFFGIVTSSLVDKYGSTMAVILGFVFGFAISICDQRILNWINNKNSEDDEDLNDE